MRPSCFTLALLFLASVAPAGAGVLYVPVPPLPDGASVDVQAVNRDHGKARRFTARLLPLATDGTASREGAPLNTLRVAAGAARSLVVDPAEQAGLLELSSAPQLSFDARVAPQAPDRFGVSLPVITSEDLIPAGEAVELPRLERSDAGVGTGLGIVNLGHAAGTCDVALNRAAGSRVGEVASVSILPLSHLHFADALAAFGAGEIGGAFVEVSCDQAFFAYALLHDAEGGLRFVTPAGRGSSSLPLPGEGPVTPPGTVSFTQPGVFHTASEAKPTQVFNIPVPAGRSFQQLELSFDYFHNGWSHTPDGNHSLFWIHRGIWLQARWADNIYAFVNAFGGHRREVKLLTNVDAGQARQVWSDDYELQAGRTYRVEYRYDTVTRTVTVKITDKTTGELVIDITGDTYGKPIVADDTGSFFVYFGHQDDTGIAPERPSYGSSWSGLQVLFLP